jgi:hypothetical protein
MARRVLLVIAVGFVLAAGLLVGTGSTATYAGQTMSCGGPIVRAESSAASTATASDRVSAGLVRECAHHDGQQLALAGIAALLGLVAGAIALTPRPSVEADSTIAALV